MKSQRIARALLLITCGLINAVFAFPVHMQSPGGSRPLSFGVSSIKASKPGPGSFSGCYKPGIGPDIIPKGRCQFRNVLIRTVIAYAYDINSEWAPDYISGGPGWIMNERYDIEAKAENDSASSADLNQMLRTMLEDRFKLSLHEITKEVAGYAMLVSKGGPKLQSPADGERPGMSSSSQPTPQWRGHNQTISNMANFLEQAFRKPVLDKTELTGRYDFMVYWTRDDSDGTRPGAIYGSNFIAAFQDQLGLKLEPQKAPARFLVIDQIDKPTEN